MYRLERQQWIPASVAEAFAFFAHADNLELLTPPWMGFEVLTPPPIVMETGTLIDYRIRLAGFPVTWRTRIDDWRPGERFVDVQLEGPYETWVHTHTFRELGEGILLTDLVEYRLPLGILGRAVHAMSVHSTLARIFDYRYSTIQRVFREHQDADSR